MPPDRSQAELSQPISVLKAEMFKAMGHAARIRILEVLFDGEHAVSEMQPLVGIEASHLSQQLGILRRAGLITNRRDGASVIYRLTDHNVVDLLAAAKRFLLNSHATREDLLAELRSADGA